MPTVSFFLPDAVGGVENAIGNLLRFRPSHFEANTEVVLYSDELRQRRLIDSLPARVTCRFSFHGKDNFVAVARRLRKIMNRDTSVIVATDYLELNMVQIEKIQCKVVFMVMGDFDHYYGIATLHQEIIDKYIAISNEIRDKLEVLLPHRRDDIIKIYLPTPSARVQKEIQTANRLKIIYVGRLDEGKNPKILPEIDDLLIAQGIQVQWTIVGEGPERKELQQRVELRTNFNFTGFITNEDLQQMYLTHDIFLMTSLGEGLPVSLVESMKAGLVPVVSNIAGGIREVVTHGVEGYLCMPEKPSEFADAIAILENQRNRLSEMSVRAARSADVKFNHQTCAEAYWKVFMNSDGLKKKNFNFKGSFLDRRFLPNAIVRAIRSSIK